jgi:hypothetical protein
VSDTRRHTVSLLLAAGLLAALYAAPTTWHAPIGIAVFVAARVVDPVVGKRLGAPRRWLATTVVLAAVGLWLGPRDGRLAEQPISVAGALAAATMAARAIGLVLLGSAAGALYPAERALTRLRRTRLRRFAEVLVVALDLVPSLIGALNAARADFAVRFPGAKRAPRRAFETFVFAVEHASALADSVARRLSAPAAKREESA